MKLQEFEVTWAQPCGGGRYQSYARNHRVILGTKAAIVLVPWNGNYGKWQYVSDNETLELRRIRRPKWLKIAPTCTGAGFSHLRAYRAEQWDPTKRTAVVRDDNGISQVVKADSASQIGGHPFRVVGRDWQERRAREWYNMQLTAVLSIQYRARAIGWMSIKQHERAVNRRFISSLFKRAA